MIPPNNTSLGIDHPLVAVHDHPRTLDNYRRLGFFPSPVSYHPWGTVTSLVMFQNNYIELIGIADVSKFGTNAVDGFCFGRYLDSFLRREEGISLVALHSNDAHADTTKLAGNGLLSQGFIDFRREMTKPDGYRDRTGCTLSLLMDDSFEDVSHFLCQQHRPDLIWIPAWQHHRNGVRGIEAITYICDPPSLLLERFTKLYGVNRVRTVKDGFVIDTGCGQFRVFDESDLQHRYVGIPLPIQRQARPHAIAITLAAQDLPTVESCCRSAGVSYSRTHDRVLIPPCGCGNVILEFTVC